MKRFVLFAVAAIIIVPVLVYFGLLLYLELTPERDPAEVALQTTEELLDTAWQHPNAPAPFDYRDLEIDRCWQFIQRSLVQSSNQYTSTVIYNSQNETYYFRDTVEIVVQITFSDNRWVRIRFYEGGTAGCQYGV
jgi:hypothetical protein